MVEPNIEIVLNERDIKTFAVVADDHFVFLNVLDKIFQVLPPDICFYGLAIIQGDCGNRIIVPVKP